MQANRQHIESKKASAARFCVDRSLLRGFFTVAFQQNLHHLNTFVLRVFPLKPLVFALDELFSCDLFHGLQHAVCRVMPRAFLAFFPFPSRIHAEVSLG